MAAEERTGVPGADNTAGAARLAAAWRCSVAGIRAAFEREAAFRQEVLAFAVLAPLAVWLPVPALERLVLVGSMLSVIVVELLNSAIEATVDRISTERHPLSGRAKDLGSAAVAVALLLSAACWATIAGPIVAAWILRE